MCMQSLCSLGGRGSPGDEQVYTEHQPTGGSLCSCGASSMGPGRRGHWLCREQPDSPVMRKFPGTTVTRHWEPGLRGGYHSFFGK